MAMHHSGWMAKMTYCFRNVVSYWVVQKMRKRKGVWNHSLIKIFCVAIMDNYYAEHPIWMVDLGEKTQVSGVVVLTWQGDGQGERYWKKL